MKAARVNWCLSGYVSAAAPRGEKAAIWFWWLWRNLSCLMPRLLVGVIVGGGLLVSSNELVTLAQRSAEDPAAWWALMLTSLVTVFWMSFSEVQQRLGRRLGAVLRGTAMIVGMGAAYVGLALAAYRRWFEPLFVGWQCGPDVGPR